LPFDDERLYTLYSGFFFSSSSGLPVVHGFFLSFFSNSLRTSPPNPATWYKITFANEGQKEEWCQVLFDLQIYEVKCPPIMYAEGASVNRPSANEFHSRFEKPPGVLSPVAAEPSAPPLKTLK
jgi:hypothetical protein